MLIFNLQNRIFCGLIKQSHSRFTFFYISSGFAGFSSGRFSWLFLYHVPPAVKCCSASLRSNEWPGQQIIPPRSLPHLLGCFHSMLWISVHPSAGASFIQLCWIWLALTASPSRIHLPASVRWSNTSSDWAPSGSRPDPCHHCLHVGVYRFKPSLHFHLPDLSFIRTKNTLQQPGWHFIVECFQSVWYNLFCFLLLQLIIYIKIVEICFK